MSEQLPYVPNYGVITKTLNKVKTAATPTRFTQDFLATKLGLKGGSARAVIPFLKRAGFIGSDGVPTELYKRFRNPTESERAAAQALRTGYRVLYDMNEYVHDVADTELKGLVVQATGLEPDSPVVNSIVRSFKALKAFGKYDQGDDEQPASEEQEDSEESMPEAKVNAVPLRMGLSYTINLNLPATSDIAVFNAIFKSLKDHLLK